MAAVVVELAREEGVVGATVLPGIEDFAASSRLHNFRTLSVSDDLPVVIEIVDREDRILALLPDRGDGGRRARHPGRCRGVALPG